MKPTILQQKFLYYYQAEFGTLFWDQNETFVDAIHESDMNFNSTYMHKVFSHFGIEIKYSKKKPKWATKKFLVQHGIAE